MKLPEFKIQMLNKKDDCPTEVMISFDDGQQYFGSFWSLSSPMQNSIANLNSSVVLVQDLNKKSIRERIENFLLNDSFHTSFFPLNKKATNNLFKLVS